MQAIITRHIPCSNTKPTRISARCAASCRVFSINQLDNAFPDLHTNEQYHRAAARLLCLFIIHEQATQKEPRHCCPPEDNVWNGRFSTGAGPNRKEFYHVFDKRMARIEDIIPGDKLAWPAIAGWDTPELDTVIKKTDIPLAIGTLAAHSRGRVALHLIADLVSDPVIYSLDKSGNTAARLLLKAGLTDWADTVPHLIRNHDH